VKPAIGSESRFLPTPPAFDAPPAFNTPIGGGVPLEYCHAVWYGKTRMLGYPTVKKILKIFLFVLTECTHVMDGETDGHRMTAKPALA